MNKELYSDYYSTITSKNPKKTDLTYYIVNTSFVKQLEQFINGGFPPDPINNKTLFNRKSIKTNLKEFIDYYAVEKNVWEELVNEFQNKGPEIKCFFDVIGCSCLYGVFDINFNLSKKNLKKKISFSKNANIKDVIDYVLTDFNIKTDTNVCVNFIENTKHVVLEGEGDLAKFINGNCNIDIVVTTKNNNNNKLNDNKKNKNNQNTKTKEKKTLTYSGLRNLGNTCYINATLQCLLSLPQFVNCFQQLKNGFSSNLISLFEQMLSNPGTTYNPISFVNGFASKVPYFEKGSQQDAHEFLSFLIDILHDENPKIIEKLFYGKIISETKCAICGNLSKSEELFSSISLPISSSKNIYFSPWNLDEPIQKIGSIPQNPIILLGKSPTQSKVIKTIEPDFTNIIAFEIPPHFDEEENLGLAILWIKSRNIEISQPLLVKVPLNEEIDESDIEVKVWNRISKMFDENIRRTAYKNFKLIDPPKIFTLIDKDGYACNEQIYVSIREPYGDKNYGFKQIRSTYHSSILSINDLIASYFDASQLDSKNKWKCGNCDNKSCAYHKIKLESLPNVVILQLKRFFVDKKIDKDNSFISIPKQINFSKYLNNDNEDDLYDLVGIVNHSGYLSSGHYTAFGKRDKRWFLFNDSNVKQMEPNESENSSSYILFYSKH